MDIKEDYHRLHLVMPVSLRDKLKKLADLDRRPLNQYLNVLLEKHVEDNAEKANG